MATPIYSAFGGLRGTGDFGTSERPEHFDEMILMLRPNGDSPIFAMTSKTSGLRESMVTDPSYHWWDEENTVPRVQIDGAQTDADTTITLKVSDAGTAQDILRLQPGDQLMYDRAPTTATLFGPTYIEVMTVVSVASPIVTVARGSQGTTAQALANLGYLTRIGNAYAEGTGSPTTTSRNPVKYQNYCQIFKTPFDVTGTAIATDYRTGPVMDREEARKTFDHSSAIEFAFLFGQKYETTGSNGKPLRTTGGILSRLSTNVTTWATAPSENDFLDALSPLFDFTADGITNERVMFCGNGFLNGINKAVLASPSSRIQHMETLNLYGMTLHRYRLPQGDIALKSHPLLNVHPIYKNTGICLAPSAVKAKYLRRTKLDKGPDGRGIQDNDTDSIKHQWLTEVGLQLRFEKAHGLFHMTSNNPA